MCVEPSPQEAARLEELRAYGVLDTPREKELDDIVRLAAKICETPIAFISLIDGDRQWFKAEVGIGSDETAIEASICARAIETPGFVEIADTAIDPLTRSLPSVTTEPGYRFYASACLQSENGFPLGTLGVSDFSPRTLTALQRETLEALAKQVMVRFELGRRIMEIERQRAALAQSEAFLRLVTDRLPVRVGYIDREFRYRFVNGAYERAFGIDRGQAQGKHVADLAGEPALEAGRPHLERALAGESSTEEFSVEYPFGMRRIRANYIPDPDESGFVRGVVVHVLDVTDRFEAEETLRTSEERFRTIFEQASDDAIVVMDADRTVIAWNPAAERLCGWTAEEAIGRRADFLFVPSDRAKGRPEREVATAAQAGKSDDDRWHLRKDGSRFWGSGTMNSLHDAQGNVRGYLKVFRDTTERYVETKTLAFLRWLTDTVIDMRDADQIVATTERMLGEYLGASRVAFAEVTPDGVYATVRQEWAPGLPSLVGVHRLADFGPTVAAEFHAGHTHVSRDAVAESAPGAGLDAVRRYRIGSGISVPVLVDGRLASVIVVHQEGPRDWTEDDIALTRQVADRMSSEIERARAEQALRQANETLEAKVWKRTEELEQAVREAEGFNYSISHDLRSPLRAMAATASILLEEAGPELSDEHREMLVRQADNSKRLGRLIDELLRLSRLSRVPVSRERLDMTAKSRGVIDEYRALGDANGCRFEIQEGMTAQGDPGLVRTILHNLIGNACKFSPPGGTVRLGEKDGVFWVHDEGIGFDMQFAPKIFLPFERLVSEAQFPGTGIGLANVKRIVERHHGRVWAESAPGQGATFYFTLGP